jgi:hypothetical protein
MNMMQAPVYGQKRLPARNCLNRNDIQHNHGSEDADLEDAWSHDRHCNWPAAECDHRLIQSKTLRDRYDKQRTPDLPDAELQDG